MSRRLARNDERTYAVRGTAQVAKRSQKQPLKTHGRRSGRKQLVARKGATVAATKPEPLAATEERGLAILERWLTTTPNFAVILARLTPAQGQVLRVFLREPSDRFVARELGLSESTVRNHLTAIEGKFNLVSREHLVAMCMAAIVRGSRRD